MHRETGKIADLKGSKVLVTSDPTSACKNCASKGSCMSSSSDKKITFWTENHINAKRGDVVSYTVEERGVVLGSLFLYVLPVVFLIGGTLLGPIAISFLNIDSDDKSVIGALCGLVLSFIIIGVISRFTKSSEMLRPKLETIICSSEESNKG
jgi:positive regulator of sigma E activity